MSLLSLEADSFRLIQYFKDQVTGVPLPESSQMSPPLRNLLNGDGNIFLGPRIQSPHADYDGQVVVQSFWRADDHSPVDRQAKGKGSERDTQTH